MIGLSYACDEITIVLNEIKQADYKKKFSPAHNFAIRAGDDTVGEIRFRIGQNKHLCNYAGQIGYDIDRRYRCNRYATKALKAILPHCFQYFPSLFITCNVDNIPSIKTIESVVHVYHGIVTIPKNTLMYREGNRKKRVYELLN